MAVSCSRTLVLQSRRVKRIISSIPCGIDMLINLASQSHSFPAEGRDYNSKIDENLCLPVPERPRLHHFDLNPVRLDCLYLSGFRLADYQHYLLQQPCDSYCNKSKRDVINVITMITRGHWMQVRF